MAITIEECYDSRTLQLGDSPSSERLFKVKGSSSATDCAAALLAQAPTLASLKLLNYSVKPIHVDTDNEASCRWLGVLSYGSARQQRADTGDSIRGFEISAGETVHTQRSLETVGSYARGGGTAPEMNGFIGFSMEGGQPHVAGVDIQATTYRWPERYYMADAYVTEDYRKTLFNLRGSVNSQAFRGFEPGEVMFDGAEGVPRDDEGDWDITYHFVASPNRYNQTMWGVSGIDKRGWDHAWPLNDVTESQNQLAPQAIAVYVDRVREWGDFSLIGIGTT